MSDLGWREAIIEVLKGATEAMHYADIAEEIKKRQLRTSFGATPANTVNVYMSDSINSEGAASPFDRPSRGYYRLRETAKKEAIATGGSSEDQSLETSIKKASDPEDPAGFINALGMYWSRDRVLWNATPQMFGTQSASDEKVDLSDQRGVYVLYDRNVVIYVGRAIDQGLGTRLKQHTIDRLNGRWDRFSWFGIYDVTDKGELIKTETASISTTTLIATMEAVLIECVEPSQNRKRGDDFRAIEFLQAEDPLIERNRMLAVLGEAQKVLIKN